MKCSWTFAAYWMFGILRSTIFLHKNLLLCYHYKRGKQYLAITIATHTKKPKTQRKEHTNKQIKTTDNINTYNKQRLPSRKNVTRLRYPPDISRWRQIQLHSACSLCRQHLRQVPLRVHRKPGILCQQLPLLRLALPVWWFLPLVINKQSTRWATFQIN